MRLNGLLQRVKDHSAKDPVFERDVAVARANAERLAGALRKRMGPVGWDQIRLADLPLGQDLEQAAPDVQRAAGIVAQEQLGRQELTFDASGARSVTVAYARKRLPWTTAEVAVLFDFAREAKCRWLSDLYRLPLGAAERLPAEQLAPLRGRLEQAERHLQRSQDSATDRNKLTRRVHTLLGEPDPADARADGPDEARSRLERAVLPPALLNDGDEWRSQLPADVQAAIRSGPLAAVLEHAGACDSVRPTRAWQQQTATLLELAPEADGFVERLLKPLVKLPLHDRSASGRWSYWLTDPNETLARGLIWVATNNDSTARSALLGELALYAGLDPAGGGSVRMPKLATSAVAALARRDDDTAVAALARLKVKARFKTLIKAVDAALDELGTRRGLERDELLEQTVPDHGLAADSTRALPAGEYRLTVTVTPPGEATLRAINSRGTVLKSIPAAVKGEHPAELASQKTLVKELKATLTAEKSRVEDLLAANRAWTASRWRQLYRQHPITQTVTEHLLWTVTSHGHDVVGLAAGDQLLDASWEPIDVPDDAQVRLWHPMDADPTQVRSWREALTAREIRQPIKQAYRELYLLTPAEIATSTYSNRYAAHVLQYRTFGALLRTRRWFGNHLGMWDGGFDGEARRTLTPTWRSVMFYELVEPPDRTYDVEFCATDQIRFERRDGRDWQVAPLDQVPPRIFSEAMRDADLFVAVTSVASDPAWVDRGQTRYRDYWEQTAFGDITESAAMRRETLRTLMPRTAIADRVEVGERFLTVRGDLRTYKIHLGSANILMEPNDAYLCIVPSRDKTDKVFLPFEEGGGRLSVIVSKAFLLAADSKITDRTITQQITGR